MKSFRKASKLNFTLFYYNLNVNSEESRILFKFYETFWNQDIFLTLMCFIVPSHGSLNLISKCIIFILLRLEKIDFSYSKINLYMNSVVLQSQCYLQDTFYVLVYFKKLKRKHYKITSGLSVCHNHVAR